MYTLRMAHDRHGGPALHWAVGGGKAEIVGLLLDEGAHATARDGAGQSALDLAEARGKDEISALLRRAGAP